MAAPLVVVGAGLAGWTTVRELRKLDAHRPVTVVTADSGDFYAKPGLSNALAQGRSPAQLVNTPAAAMAQSLNVTLLAHTRVLSLDTARQALALQTGGGSLELAYDRLVLATGAQPIRTAIGGNAAHEVLSVNSLDDFAVFHSRLAGTAGGAQTGSTVLVIGAGLIGCEFANDLLAAGHRVHVVDPSPRPLASLLPAAAGGQLRSALQALGARWHLGATVQAVDRLADGGAGLDATLSDGTRLVVDVVLSAVGLRADTTLARAAGLLCDRGIVVDRYLRTSAERVHALGDCAQYASAQGRTLPFVMPIMHAARTLAANLAGRPTELAFPLMPVSVKTPALPIVVAPPPPQADGAWATDGAEGAGIWRYVDVQGLQRGFALSGKGTSRRQEMVLATAS